MTEHFIRRFRSDDIPILYKIEETVYFDPWPISAFHDCLWIKYPCYLLERKGKIVAYAIWHYILDESHLLNLCVHPRYQGLGIAAELLQFVLTKSQEDQAKLIFLEVRASNSAAIHLYEKFGFKIVGLRKNYYITPEGPENAIIYRLNL